MTRSGNPSEELHVKIEIATPQFLADHRINGYPVLPGAHAVNLVAKEINTENPDIDVTSSGPARFLRLLPLEKNCRTVEAEIRISSNSQDSASVSLYTRRTAGCSTMMRSKKHVEVVFGEKNNQPNEDWDMLCGLEGVCRRVDAKDIYDEIADFGPSFHNIVGTVFLSPDGAFGRIGAPVHKHDSTHIGPLGSFFPIDAAFHIASAWSTRYTGRTVFPVGYSYRFVGRPPLPGQTFFCRVLPKCIEGSSVHFDIYIHDEDGRVSEKVLGLSMTDFPGKSHRPPEKLENIFPDKLPGSCSGFCVVELDTVPPYANRSFSGNETTRYSRLGPGRKRAFAAAHLALKKLARRLGHTKAASTKLCTVTPDRHLPVCPAGQGRGTEYASAAHDDRFAVAAAAEYPVGVDVEKISDKVERAARFFLTPEEDVLVRRIEDMQRPEALTKIWCIKESAAKALNIPLAETFSRVRVNRIDSGRCTAYIDKTLHPVFCTDIENHIISLLVVGPVH